MRAAWAAGVLVLVLAACGGDPAPTGRVVSTSVPAADQACRDQWQRLGDRVAAGADQGVLVRRAFRSRWEATTAGIAYYAGAATAEQCGALFDRQREQVRYLDALVTRLLPLDMEQQAAEAQVSRPARPSRAERRAFRTLTARSVAADRDIAPAVTHLAAVDPTDARRVRRALADLALLARASTPWTACRRAVLALQ